MSCVILCSSGPARADDAEARAVEFVRKLGGTVARDRELPGKPFVEVILSGRQVTDAGLKELGKALQKCMIVKGERL